MDNELLSLGFTPFFSRQLTAEEFEHAQLARVVEVQRSHVYVSNGVTDWQVVLGGSWYRLHPEGRPTVGDWVSLDERHEKIVRLLERKSLFKRVAAGDKVDVQLVAANIDTLFIVTSCNEEFKESRLERYLALAHEAGVDPVVVLTKADMTADAEVYRDRVRALNSDLPIELVNGLDAGTLEGVSAWITTGSTVALVGSSGVGKSTIVNSLSGKRVLATAVIREQDAKGRHTTSYRSLHRITGGGMLLDVPGMRELKVAHLDSSLEEVFTDIATLGEQCRFSDCAHEEEPGCAVRKAVNDSMLDERRLSNYQKLLREETRNTASIAEQRHRDRQFAKIVKEHVDLKRQIGKRKG
jgi:ribosome biogenesis GTPase